MIDFVKSIYNAMRESQLFWRKGELINFSIEVMKCFSTAVAARGSGQAGTWAPSLYFADLKMFFFPLVVGI